MNGGFFIIVFIEVDFLNLGVVSDCLGLMKCLYGKKN